MAKEDPPNHGDKGQKSQSYAKVVKTTNSHHMEESLVQTSLQNQEVNSNNWEIVILHDNEELGSNNFETKIPTIDRLMGLTQMLISLLGASRMQFLVCLLPPLSDKRVG